MYFIDVIKLKKIKKYGKLYKRGSGLMKTIKKILLFIIFALLIVTFSNGNFDSLASLPISPLKVTFSEGDLPGDESGLFDKVTMDTATDMNANLIVPGVSFENTVYKIAKIRYNKDNE